MEYIIDIILAALLAVCLIVGWKRGFVKSLMDLASNLIAFILARVVSVQLAPQIFAQYFEQRAYSSLNRELASAGSSASSQVQSALDSIPESLDGFLGMLGVDKKSMASALSQKLEESGADIAEVLMNNIVSPVLTAIIKLLVFVAVFVLAVLILKIAALLLDKLTELPAVKQANEIFGLLFGAVKGVIVIAVACFALELIAGVIGNDSLTSLVESSRIVGAFDNVLNLLNIQS